MRYLIYLFVAVLLFFSWTPRGLAAPTMLLKAPAEAGSSLCLDASGEVSHAADCRP